MSLEMESSKDPENQLMIEGNIGFHVALCGHLFLLFLGLFLSLVTLVLVERME